MEYSKILEHLQESSAYDLYRLQNVLERWLDDPNRVFRIKKAIHPGDVIEYYDSAEDREVKARVLSFQRSRLVVENLHDQKKFNIPYIAVNTAALAASEHCAGVDRKQLQIGQMVSFYDAEGTLHSGEIIELSHQGATLETELGVWRVSYAQLMPYQPLIAQESNQR